MDEANLEATIRDCLDGRPGAWEALVNAYAKRVFNLAYQFSGSHQEAEDQTQEVFLKLYGALPKFDFQRSFTAWLLTLAKNHLIDEYRRTKWQRTQREDFDERTAAAPLAGNPQDALEREENRRLVWDSLNSLTSDMRMAVILRDLQGRSYEEIAQVLDLPLGTVKSRVNRARLALARVVEEKRGGEP
jgi:RNA polymerase sigma-70 factor (ECF subfamily)